MEITPPKKRDMILKIFVEYKKPLLSPDNYVI